MSKTEKFCFSKNTQEILEKLTIPFAIYQYIDKRVVTIVLSKGFCDEFGFQTPEDAYQAMDHDMYRATHPDDRARVADAAFLFAAHDHPYDIIYRTRTLKDPDYIILHSYGKSIYPEPGVRLCLVWYAFEGHLLPDKGITESVMNQVLNRFLSEESEYRSIRYDYMTGLPNMAYFFELAEAGRKRMAEKHVDSAILFFDLTGLKQFNQRYGFAEGNHLICDIADILARHFSSENCARFAQDHFAAFAPLEGLTEKLDAVIAECGKANGGKNLPVRIGVYPDRIEDVEVAAACDRARIAADIRKKIKTSYYSFFDMDMMAAEKNRQEIINQLDTAIEEGWIRVYYQPIVRSTNGKVCNAEALARWEDPVRGMLMPSSFIPVLEEAMLIHKLDLCIVKQVLNDLKDNERKGVRNIPISINFSRADFDACDLVEEICALVDEAQVDHRMINIEITESMVGSDLTYMKEQVDRFHDRGFQVWMDDFGSGYSSLDVLQSIHFDLIKFDMGFMKQLDEGTEGKIILTELMRMANSLGVDTVCEGVETEKQIQFLREISCSKLQGYYYMKPVPRDQILKRFTVEQLNGFEDPRETDYYDAMGRVNLYDLSFLADDYEDVIKNTYDTVPMGIMEVSDDCQKAIYIRSNQSFRDFMKRLFGLDLSNLDAEHVSPSGGPGYIFMKTIEQCRKKGSGRTFINEELEDGTVVHSFVRRIAENPVTGKFAIAVVVLSVTDPVESTTYEGIARSLAADYYNIFVIDLDTNHYIEYSSEVGGEELSIKRQGEDFFESARRDTMIRIYEEDREPFLQLFTKQNVLRELDTQGVFTTTYRLIDTGSPMYVNMKITRMRGGNRIILGISIIDAQMKQQEEEKKLRQEKISLGRIAALSPNYIVLYTVDPETGHYTQYNPSNEFASFGLASQGDDFFGDVILDAPKVIDPEDMERHLSVLTKENMMRQIQQEGFFTHNYRLVLHGQSVPVSLKATLVEESDGEKILLGVVNDEEAYLNSLKEAYEQEQSKSTIYKHLAHALARGYTDLFYVNLETDELIEYHTDDERGVLTEARQSNDFFEGCERDVKLYVHPDDQEKFVKAMNREFLADALSRSKIFEMTYRRIKDGRTFYVQMRVSRVDEDQRYIVIAVSDIDELMQQRSEEERIQEERIVYARLHAITGNYICVYVVDPETGRYREFSATDDFAESFGQAKIGDDFFSTVQESAHVYSHPNDLNRFLSSFTKENVLKEIDRSGIFTISYRLLMNGEARHIQLNAAMVEEKEGPRLIVGLNDVEAQVRQQEEYGKRLAKAQTMANVDALTKIKSKHAYLEAEIRMDRQIAEHRQTPFAVVILDINDLKKINDTKGHKAGDQYICAARTIICDIFKHSPVFRIGGDEFAVIAFGSDYENIEERVETVRQHNMEALRNGGIVIACGMSVFNDDTCVAEVFERADHKMYENKNELKSIRI